jgi:Na+/glutamate symporter
VDDLLGFIGWAIGGRDLSIGGTIGTLSGIIIGGIVGGLIVLNNSKKSRNNK